MKTTKTWSMRALVAIAAIIIALDQYVKHLVRMSLPINTTVDPIPQLGRILSFTHVENTGAAFGLLRDNNTLFVILPLIVVAVVVGYSARVGRQPWPLMLAFGLQVGGALGNVIDRIARGGVTDFVDLHFWPIFNVADSAVVIGTIILAVVALFMDEDMENGPISEEGGDELASGEESA